MRSTMWMLFLAPALCAPAALAIDRTSVDIPFSFESNGKIFPASQYNVELNENRNMLVLTSKKNPSDSLTWWAIPTQPNPNDATLSIEFGKVGTIHELHVIRLGSYTTPALDTSSTIP